MNKNHNALSLLEVLIQEENHLIRLRADIAKKKSAVSTLPDEGSTDAGDLLKKAEDLAKEKSAKQQEEEPPLLEQRQQELMAKFRQHRKAIPRAAFCCSGGGIRSACLNLGVAQGLAGLHLLDRFDYLSTVSGGGYFGTWLSTWIRAQRMGGRSVASASLI